MLDQFLGFILLGLGLQSPMTPPVVLGDETEQSQSNSGSGNTHSDDSDENEAEQENESDGATGTSGGTTVTPTVYTKVKDGMPINLSPERKELYKKELEKRKVLLETKRKETEAQYKAKRETLKKELLERKDLNQLKKSSPPAEIRKHMSEEKEAFIASVKAKIEQTQEEREAKLAEFKEKIQVFKDTTKKTKVEDIQSKLLTFVSKRIESMTAQLTKMNDIIATNKSQVSERAGDKNTDSFDQAAVTAQTAINTAKDKLSTLSAKQYVITVGSEDTVKQDVKSVHSAVESDMKSILELIKNARIAVSKMIIERAKVLGEPVPEAVIR